MADHGSRSGAAARPRLPWVLFCGISALVLGASVVAAMETGSRSDVGLAMLGSLVVIGIGAALVSSIVSPDRDGSRYAPYGADGGRYGGGDHGGGDCGGGDFGGGGC